MSPLASAFTIAEAAHKWGVSESTIKSRLRVNRHAEQVESLKEQGLIKAFIKPNGKRKDWIISEQAMEIWFEKQR